MSKTRILIVLAVATLIAGLAASPSQAEGDRRHDRLETAGELHGLSALVKAALAGRPTQGVRITKLDNGWGKAVIPLPDSARADRLDGSASAAKSIENLTITIDLFEPDLFADIVNYDCAPLADFDYHWGFVSLNTTNSDISRKTTFQRKGPGSDFKVTETLVYDANALNLFWIVRQAQAGLHTLTLKGNGGKKIVTKTLVGGT